MIVGTNCELYRVSADGIDPFGAPTGAPEKYATIVNVLAAPVSSEDNATAEQLYGRAATYELCFPKAVTQEDLQGVLAGGFVKLPLLSGFEFDPVGEPIEYIEENVPLLWNIKLKVALRR